MDLLTERQASFSSEAFFQDREAKRRNVSAGSCHLVLRFGAIHQGLHEILKLVAMVFMLFEFSN